MKTLKDNFRNGLMVFTICLQVIATGCIIYRGGQESIMIEHVEGGR